MNIVYVTSEYINPVSLGVVDGGLANYLYKITNEMHRLGNSVTVIVLDNVNKTIFYNDIKVIFIKNRPRNSLFTRIKHLFLSKKTRAKIKKEYVWNAISKTIRREHSKHKIDIVQYASYLATGKNPEAKIPSCVRISSYEKTQQKYYGISNPEMLKNEIEQFKKTRFLFGPSRHIANYIKKDLELTNDIEIIESPYPEDIENENHWNFETYKELKQQIGNSRYILFFGSIGKLKGGEQIAGCVYDWLKKHKDTYLVLVGKSITINNIDCASEIQKAAKEYANHVIRFPSQSHDKLYPIIKNSYGVLMPSMIENFSNACVEAMRLRKIVIGTQDNFSQLITDGKNGFLCQVGDSKSLASCIERLLELSPEQKEKMEEKAFERTNTLSTNNICKKLLDYYNQVIKNW